MFPTTLLIALALWFAPRPRARPIRAAVFAAASLTNALEAIVRSMRRRPASRECSFGASSALARQLEAGASADVFFPADIEWMDYLQARNLIARETRRDVLATISC